MLVIARDHCCFCCCPFCKLHNMDSKKNGSLPVREVARCWFARNAQLPQGPDSDTESQSIDYSIPLKPYTQSSGCEEHSKAVCWGVAVLVDLSSKPLIQASSASAIGYEAPSKDEPFEEPEGSTEHRSRPVAVPRQDLRGRLLRLHPGHRALAAALRRRARLGWFGPWKNRRRRTRRGEERRGDGD